LLTLAAPLWLTGLLLLPVIRWLHRGGRHRRTLRVSHLGLWRGSADSPPAAGERRPPDPAWRRRALFTALLLAALAEPRWPGPRAPVTLWIDDSISMLTREGQATRLADGLARARSLLAGQAQATAELRTLGDPWRRLGEPSDAVVDTVLAGAGRQEPAAPPAALLHRDRAHWLVTDGADAALLEWPGGRRPDRIVQVARVTRNVGLQRLSARRNADDPDRFDLLVKLTNGGDVAESRDLVVTVDGRQRARSTHRLEAGTSVHVQSTIAATGRVRATLQPGDALAEDDAILLDLSPLRRRRIAVGPGCPAALEAAVSAHPALAGVPHDAADADAVVACAPPGATGRAATIRVRVDRLPMPLSGPLSWSSAVPESRRVRLDAAGIRVSARLHAGPADTTLLAIGGEPVIVRRAGASGLLETSLDFGSMAATRGAEVPLLANALFEESLGSRLLDAIAVVDRGPSAVQVVPAQRLDASAQAAAPPSDRRVLSAGTRPLVVAALLVLLWEVVALGRQWLRSRTPVEARLE
jgi:hypothetical protein